MITPKRILLIQGEGPVREALARLLAAQGHEVRVAGGAEEAMDRLGELGPDVIIYDAESPDDSTGQAIGGVREAAGDCRLIALTAGQRISSSMAETRVDGADFALPRPTNLNELRRILREE